MMQYRWLNPYFFKLLFCFFILTCTPNQPEQTVQSVATPQDQHQQAPPQDDEVKPITQPPVQTSEEPPQPAPAQDQFWIAKLKSSTNRVDFKSKSGSIWQAATTDMNFFKYDSIQTHQQSTALIRYQSKSEIEVKEKSLLVFDEDPGSKKKKIDRVILKTGDLLGKTSTELWVLTSAGLVQISGEKHRPAKARVQIKNEQFKISVDQGTALLTVKNHNNEIQKISIEKNNIVDLSTQNQIRPLTASLEETSNIEEVISAAATVSQPIEQKVNLENTDETEIAKKNVYQLNGKISAVGAKLLVNGELLQIGPDLSFSKDITLTKGSNLIVLQLIRSDSTTQFIRKKVVLED